MFYSLTTVLFLRLFKKYTDILVLILEVPKLYCILLELPEELILKVMIQQKSASRFQLQSR